jgi:hypothetical protein
MASSSADQEEETGDREKETEYRRQKKGDGERTGQNGADRRQAVEAVIRKGEVTALRARSRDTYDL